MQTLEREMAQAIDEANPGRWVVIVTITFDDVPERLDVYGPFEEWRDAADWNNNQSYAEGIYATVHPLIPPETR